MRLIALLLALFATAAIAADLPAPATGYSDVRLKPVWQAPVPSGDGVGAVRTTCFVSHFNYDDPLRFPNQPGRAHLHMYWGNTGTNADSTPESLLASGNGTCRGGILNRSAYWIPAVLDGDRVIVPSRIQVYYKTGYELGDSTNRRNEEVQPIPQGLRLIALSGRVKYAIVCGGVKGNEFSDCDGRTALDVMIDLPQCWDGLNLYKADQTHMRYARRSLGGCPASNPIPLPQVSFLLAFDAPEGSDPANWRLSSDGPYDAGGTTMHADWMEGWAPGRSDIWTREIINRGLDGGSHHAGNGEQWY